MTPMDGPFFREAGQGATVLCLHSNAGTSGQRPGPMDLLSPRLRVLAPDLSGTGRAGARVGGGRA